MAALNNIYQRAYERAAKVLNPGDRVRVSYCGGTATFTFRGWTGPNGQWLDTASGYDLHPFNVSKVNGVPADFTEELEAA